MKYAHQRLLLGDLFAVYPTEKNADRNCQYRLHKENGMK
jgi:hypothetical protein